MRMQAHVQVKAYSFDMRTMLPVVGQTTEVRNEVRNPERYANDLPEIQTLSEAVRHCKDYWGRNNPNSLDTYVRHMSEFSKWAHNHLSHPILLKHIDQHVLTRYRWYLENRPARDGGVLKPASVNVKLSSLAALFKVLVKQGYLKETENPMQKIETTRTRRDRLQREPFEELRLPVEKLKEILAWPFEEEGYWGLRDKALLYTIGYFGVRPVEVTWMKMSQLTGNTHLFRRAKRNYPGSFWTPDEYVDLMKMVEYRYGIQPHQSMFLGQYRTGITVKSIQNIVRKYGEKVGISNLRPKDIRATLETFMEENFEGTELDKYMGYAPPGTARKYYVKVPKTAVQGMFDTWVSVLKG